MLLRPTLALAILAFSPAAFAQEAPDDQKAFVAAISASRDTYDNAENDLQKSSERKARAKALCDLVAKGPIDGWVGKIYDLTTNSDGDGVLTVELDGEVWIGTFNNTFSDDGLKTLIPSDSDLYATLSKMANEQQVSFSGSFFRDAKDNPDCLREKSLTEVGAMSQPEFLFKFKEVNALD